MDSSLKSELAEIKSKYISKADGEWYLEVGSGREFEDLIGLLDKKSFILANMFCVQDFLKPRSFSLMYVFEKRSISDFLILVRTISAKDELKSIAKTFPTAVYYEREITDGFGLKFDASFDERRLFLHEIYPKTFHPLLKSFKNAKIEHNPIETLKSDYEFKRVEGEGVFEIPVGPIHAGIIEPGHFRFSVIGENIFHLELRMFWKHRGVEKLAEEKPVENVVKIAEAISGDETVANAIGYCRAIENIGGVTVPKRGEYLRVIFSELERIYSLMGDLGGMVIDVAYPVGAMPFLKLREDVFRENAKLTGSRFMKGAICLGGVSKDVDSFNLVGLHSFLEKFVGELNGAVESVLPMDGIIDRFATTGIVKKEVVAPLNLSGPIARAAGEATDVRINHQYGAYDELKPRMILESGGDVMARFKLKVATILNSIELIQKAVKNIPQGHVNVAVKTKNGHAMSVVESARGQNIHWVCVKKGVVNRYKVRTASFNNWIAVEHAIQGNIVPDFPLINKSMNLSYAGTDL